MSIFTKPSESNSQPTTGTRWLKRLGLVGFTLFFLKGMMWLLIPWLTHTALF